MPQVPINYFAVITSAVVSMVLGFVWYGPVFGKQWMKLSGFTEESMKAAKAKGMTTSYVIMLIGSLVMSYVLAHAIVFASAYLKVTGVKAGLMAGVWNWLGFVAPVTVGSVLWDNKSWKLWILNNAYYLCSLLAMGAILTSWQS